MASPYAHLWDLDPGTTYLNHGSFGPSPTVVRSAREEWTARLEQQPMRFFCTEMEDQLDRSAEVLAGFLQTKAARIALVENATVAMNVAASTIKLQSGDEVLLTNHEYGAVRNIWQHRCQQVGGKLMTVDVPCSSDTDEIVTAIEEGLTERTKVLVVSHVTSATAMLMPIAEICSTARRHGVLVVVDGPHAVAMLDLQVDQLGCDFYCGSGHKWLCASFGSGFLWVHPRHHGAVRCPVVSWGGSISGRSACWQDRVNWPGTRDPSPLLSIAAAIEFLKELGLGAFRAHAQERIRYAATSLSAIDGIQPLIPFSEPATLTMAAFTLPQPDGWQPGYHGKADALQLELREQHGIEVPVFSWNGQRLLRLSAHLYNGDEDVDRLVAALRNTNALH